MRKTLVVCDFCGNPAEGMQELEVCKLRVKEPIENDGLKIFPLVTLLIGGLITFSLTFFSKLNHLHFFFYTEESVLPRAC